MGLCLQLTQFTCDDGELFYLILFSSWNHKYESLTIVQGQAIKHWYALYILLCSSCVILYKPLFDHHWCLETNLSRKKYDAQIQPNTLILINCNLSGVNYRSKHGNCRRFSTHRPRLNSRHILPFRMAAPSHPWSRRPLFPYCIKNGCILQPIDTNAYWNWCRALITWFIVETILERFIQHNSIWR